MKRMLNFIIVGIVVVGVVGSLVVILASSGWKKANGVILDSDIKTIKHTDLGSPLSDDSNQFDYEVVIKYEYTVSGKKYTGNRLYARMPNVISNHVVANDIVEKYPKASNVDVYYNPKDPGESCLETLEGVAVWRRVLFAFLILGVLAVFIVGFYYANRILN